MTTTFTPNSGSIAYTHINIYFILESCIIPKGTLCSLSLWGAGRSSRAWGEDADEFVPERWLQPQSISNAAFMPFSVGRRACIGMHFILLHIDI